MGKEQYTIAIIGAGNIAAGYDSPESEDILTHAHAIKLNSRLNCIGLFDIDAQRAQVASRKWDMPSITSENLRERKPDIVVVCSPDTQHVHDLRELADRSPAFILCEKPLTTNLKESEHIASLLKERKIPLMVNYQRRYDATVLELKGELQKETYGKPLAVNVLYSKGILHNGSHAVNLLLFLFGAPLGLIVTGKKNDFYESDPSVEGSLFFRTFAATFIAGDERQFSLFEVDIILEKARFRFIASGNEYEVYSVAPDQLFPDYKELRFEAKKNTRLRYALKDVYADIVAHLDNGKKTSDHLDDALSTQLICELFATSSLYQHHKLDKIETC